MGQPRTLLAVAVGLLLSGAPLACAHHPAPPASEAPMNQDAIRGVTDPRLQALLSEHWEHTLAASPTWASRLGDHRYDDRLEDHSLVSVQADRALRDGWLTRARALPADTLGPADALTLSLFVDLLAEDAATDVCRAELWTLNPRVNPLAQVNELPDVQPIETLQDGRNLVARYRAIPTLVDGWTVSLREGVRQGYTPPAASVRLVLDQLRDELQKGDDTLTLAAPLHEAHDGWPAADLARFRADLGLAITDARAALGAFTTFVEVEVLPASRPADREGVGYLPDGKACYAASIRRETSLDLPAAEVHATGLHELERIHGEMRALGARLFGTDDLAAIFAHLRDDPALRFTSAAEILAAASDHLARAKAAMPGVLGHPPAADCVVKPIPDYLAPYTYIAYYNPAVPDGSQPGEYRVNTYQPETRRRFELAVLSFHEAIPGHHLQIALAQELPDLPAFRRHGGWNAFVEGWALYAERIADEDGLYPGDLDRMGLLAFDSWRASRLVVDTGLHDQGWTREQAVQFMLANTPLAENNIRNEVDRYIGWPGQALSYKLGQLEILALRAEAERRLGERFDRRAFHDLLLGAGAVSLPVLRSRVEAWIVGQGG